MASLLSGTDDGQAALDGDEGDTDDGKKHEENQRNKAKLHQQIQQIHDG